MYFNPRTHVGCDIGGWLNATSGQISIHAPTWGATPSDAFKDKEDGLSIHAPTWGAT